MAPLDDFQIFEKLKNKRFAQFFIVYAVVAWGALQVVDQLADRSIVPELVYRVALTMAACGLPGVAIVTWFHGAKGDQKMVPLEKWLLAGVGVFAVVTSIFVIRAETVPDLAGTTPAAVEPYEDPARVAVLYFDPRGSDQDAEFISAGLTEGLIDDLSSVDQLHVVSRNGSAMFRGNVIAPDSIGRALEVGTLVGGRVTISGDQVRVDVELIESSSGRQLASTRLEQARTDVFVLQDELTDEVSAFLRERIGGELALNEQRRTTSSREAWEFAQQANDLIIEVEGLVSEGDTDAAVARYASADSLFALAESADPRWITAVTGRGWIAYERARLFGTEREPQDQWTLRGLEFAERALAMNADDPDALELRGTLVYWRYLLGLADSYEDLESMFAQAEEDFEAATAEDPEQASAFSSLSHLLMNKGELSQAKLAAVRSYEADPFLQDANLTLWRLTSASWQLADGIEAGRWCDEGFRRFPGDYRFTQCRLMIMALPNRPADIPGAWALHEDFVRLSPPELQALNEGRGLMSVAMALVRANRPDSARAVAVRGRVGPEVDPTRDVAGLEAIVRAWLGDYEEAVSLLSTNLAANPGALDAYRGATERGETPWPLADLADHPEYRALLGLR